MDGGSWTPPVLSTSTSTMVWDTISHAPWTRAISFSTSACMVMPMAQRGRRMCTMVPIQRATWHCCAA